MSKLTMCAVLLSALLFSLGHPAAPFGQNQYRSLESPTPRIFTYSSLVTSPNRNGITPTTPSISSEDEGLSRNILSDTLGTEQQGKNASSWWDTTWESIVPWLNSPWAKIISFLSPLIVLLEWFLHPIRKLYRWWKRRDEISYDRYRDQLRKDLEEYKSYPALELKRAGDPQPSENSIDKERAGTVSEVVAYEDDLHILGRPGSGKSSMLKKHALALCSQASSSWRWESTQVPVYVEYRGKSLFEQIINSLNTNELAKDSEQIERAWLRDELQTGKFTILIDDVHIFLSNEDERRKSMIRDLLEYKKNTFILSGRNYYPYTPVERMSRFEIQDLSESDEKVQKILQIHTDKTRAEQVWRHIRFDSQRRDLYSTPQYLALLGQSFDPDDPARDNRSLLFSRFLEHRHEREKRKTGSTSSLKLKKQVLGYVAFRAFGEKDGLPYSLPHNEFRSMLSDGVQKAQEEYGYDSSVDSIEQELLREGYLVNHENTVEFEHDQWQEFFAALEIRREQHSIADLFPGNPAREVAYFISSFYLPEDQRQNRNFWKKFWGHIVSHDFFLFEECLNSRGFVTQKDFFVAFEGFEFTDEELHSAYLELADCYSQIIDSHFPNLVDQFAPNYVNEEIGVLVERKYNSIDFWYGYRPVGPDGKKVVIVDQNKMMKQNDVDRPLENVTFYEQEFDVGYWHSRPSTPVHDTPVVVAYRDIRKQISDFVRKGELEETPMMRQETMYNVAVALSKRLTGRGRPSSNVTEQFVLPVGELLSGLQQLKARRFKRKIDVPGATYHFHDLPDRKITLEDVESQLRRYVHDYDLQPSDKIATPNADLLEVINRYRWGDDEITSSDREFLILRSEEFYSDLYRNYKSVLKTSFPTSKKSFRTYSGFPIQVFLVRKESENRRYFGEHRVYFNVERLSGWGSVEIIEGEETQKVQELDGRYRYIMQPWRFDSFSRVEPIRSAVYRLIQREYEDLVDRL